MALFATQGVNNHVKKHSNAIGTVEDGGKSLLSQAIPRPGAGAPRAIEAPSDSPH
jgi:hypothetical protein